MLRIGMFSQLGKTTVKTLRYYDEIGLLKPDYTDQSTGYRYYGTHQLFRLHQIVALRQMGFAIPEIAAALDGRDMEGILQRHKRELETELDAAASRLFRLEHFIQQQKEGIAMSYQAVIKDIPGCIVFSQRTVLPNYDALFQLMPALGERVGKANPGLECVQPDYCFNIYHDGEYKETDIDVELCQAVTARGKDGEGFVFKDVPAVTAATVLHKGPYSDLRAAYAYILSWVEQNGYEVDGFVRESYIDGVWNRDSDADWLTEIQVPVKKRG